MTGCLVIAWPSMQRYSRLSFPFFALALATSGAISAGAASWSDSDRYCLALNLYWEAKNEDRDGMVAIASVVLNRVEDPAFPDTICAVVRQGGEAPPCQFSWWCDGKSDLPRKGTAWSRASRVAGEFLDRRPRDPTGGALFYHHISINVPWKVKRERTAIIGRHAYYR